MEVIRYAPVEGTSLDSNTIHEQSIVLDLKSQTKKEAIYELIDRAPVFGSVGDLEHLKTVVLAREEGVSTGFGRGVAISHGESEGIREMAVAVGLSKEGIEFDSLDGKPVHILFLIVNPADEKGGYLDALSTITSLLRDEVFRTRLSCCECIREVEDTLREGIDLCSAKR